MTDLRRTNEALTKRFSEQSQQNETYKARVSNLEAELEMMRDKVAEFDAMEERLHELEEFKERTLQAGNDVIAHNTPKPQETKSEGIPHSDDIDLHDDLKGESHRLRRLPSLGLATSSDALILPQPQPPSCAPPPVQLRAFLVKFCFWRVTALNLAQYERIGLHNIANRLKNKIGTLTPKQENELRELQRKIDNLEKLYPEVKLDGKLFLIPSSSRTDIYNSTAQLSNTLPLCSNYIGTGNYRQESCWGCKQDRCIGLDNVLSKYIRSSSDKWMPSIKMANSIHVPEEVMSSVFIRPFYIFLYIYQFYIDLRCT